MAQVDIVSFVHIGFWTLITGFISYTLYVVRFLLPFVNVLKCKSRRINKISYELLNIALCAVCMQKDYLAAVVLIFITCVILSIVILTINFLFGSYFMKNKDKNALYECGFQPFSNTRMPFYVQFFLTNISFLIFDLEAIFLFPYTISAYKSGGIGVFVIYVFCCILVLGFIYEKSNKVFSFTLPFSTQSNNLHSSDNKDKNSDESNQFDSNKENNNEENEASYIDLSYKNKPSDNELPKYDLGFRCFLFIVFMGSMFGSSHFYAVWLQSKHSDMYAFVGFLATSIGSVVWPFIFYTIKEMCVNVIDLYTRLFSTWQLRVKAMIIFSIIFSFIFVVFIVRLTNETIKVSGGIDGVCMMNSVIFILISFIVFLAAISRRVLFLTIRHLMSIEDQVREEKKQERQFYFTEVIVLSLLFGGEIHNIILSSQLIFLINPALTPLYLCTSAWGRVMVIFFYLGLFIVIECWLSRLFRRLRNKKK